MAVLAQSQSTSTEQANYQHLVWDIAWFGIALAATTRFSQFYALEMGASALELGWLAALPSLVLLFSTGLSTLWRRRFPSALASLVLPAIGHRLIFLLPAFAPFFPETWRIPWIIAAATLPAIPQGIASTIFLVMMREHVYPQSFQPLVTRRQMAINVALMIGTLSFGLLLEVLPFPLNYQVMFGVATLFSAASLYQVFCLKPINGIAAEKMQPAPRRSWRELLADKGFISASFMMMNIHLVQTFIVAPQALHLKTDFAATEGFLAIFGATEVLAAAVVTLWLPKWMSRYGNRRVATFGLLGLALGAVGQGLMPHLYLTLLPAAVNGAAWTVTFLAALGIYNERTASNDYQATNLWHQLLFAAAFVGPMLGSTLIDSGLSPALVLGIGGGLRLIAAALAYFEGSLFKLKRETV